MAQLIEPTPILPRAITNAPNVESLAKYDAALNTALFQALIRIAFRLNLAVMSDGSEAPALLPNYTVATAPSVTTYAGSLIYVTDEAGGPTVAYSNGTNWKRVYDNTNIS